MVTKDRPDSGGNEDYLLAAICHLAVIMPIAGIVIPASIWFAKKDRSPFLKLQSSQAMIYQALVILLSMISVVIFFFSMIVSFAGMMAGSMGTTVLPLFTPEGSEPAQWIKSLLVALAVIPVFLPYILGGIFLIILTLHIVYGFIAVAVTLMGKDFRYLLIGRMVENKLER